MWKRAERTRTTSEQTRQTEKETMADREGEKEIRWSGQTLGLEPRTQARKRDSDRVRLVGGIYEVTHTRRLGGGSTHSLTWEGWAQCLGLTQLSLSRLLPLEPSEKGREADLGWRRGPLCPLPTSAVYLTDTANSGLHLHSGLIAGSMDLSSWTTL